MEAKFERPLWQVSQLLGISLNYNNVNSYSQVSVLAERK
jgi:hypothetical protein